MRGRDQHAGRSLPRRTGYHLTGNEGASDKAPVDHGVGEHDEPRVPRALLELTAGLGAADTAGRVLATEANPNLYIQESIRQNVNPLQRKNGPQPRGWRAVGTYQETPGRQDVEHANDGALVVRGGSESREDDQNDGGD